jgi:hypothetical protein
MNAKQIKNCLISSTAALMMLTASQLSATQIDFTAAEGYSAGNLNSNANWWAFNAGGIAYAVDPSAGTVTWDPAFANQRAVYQQALSIAQQSFTVSMDFSFAGLGDRTGNIFLPSIQFGTVSNADGAIGLALWRPNNASNYQMYFVVGSSAQGGTGDHRTNSLLFSNASIGDNGTLNDQTDLLRMELTMTRTAANTWEFLGNLYNMDVDPTTVVSTVSGGGVTLSETYNTSDWYTVMRSGSGSGSTPSGTTSFVIESFGAEAIPEPRTYALIFGLSAFALVVFKKYRGRK